ncbi:MAG: ROK family protein [Fimbriimonadaceae bacterium]|nr:ROK family protein [Fimbriimonadaceae bacterium]QYK55196.1 MAG: ROK family protein [Fimbriimonadaceae bacterium]
MELWGIDLGGTKIEGVVLKGDYALKQRKGGGARVLARLRIPTQAERGYEAIVGRVQELVRLMEEETGLSRPDVIGIGTPGSVDPVTGLMKNCNTACLNGRSLQDHLTAALGAEARIANDADCFALAEAHAGAGMGAKTVFGVIMGTGVGGGIVVDGNLLTGPNGIAGEWGHATLWPDGEPCYCGRKGCVERYLSGPAVEQFHARKTLSLDGGVAHGEGPLSLREIAARAETDATCRETVERFCDDFGRALSLVVNILDPDCVVLGGGAGQVPQLRTLGRERLAANVFNPRLATPLLAPAFGDSAGVFGAAWLTARPC